MIRLTMAVSNHNESDDMQERISLSKNVYGHEVLDPNPPEGSNPTLGWKFYLDDGIDVRVPDPGVQVPVKSQ